MGGGESITIAQGNVGFFWPWFYVVFFFFFLKNILLLAHKSIWKDEIYFFPSLILKSRAKPEPQKQVR